jgi:hypothetical protein
MVRFSYHPDNDLNSNGQGCFMVNSGANADGAGSHSHCSRHVKMDNRRNRAVFGQPC